MDEEKQMLINAFVAEKSKLENAWNYTLENPKDSEASYKVRKEGNAVFSQTNLSHELLFQVLSLYNKSVCLAPSDCQELAYAIANRSALLLYIGKYQECIQDVQKALEITDSTELKVKLMCRQVECLKNLGDAAYENLLEEAQTLIDDIDENSKNKQILRDMIKKVSKLVVKKAKTIREPAILPVTDNVLDKVSIRHNEKFGRHLVAEQDYQPGDIILVEKFFSCSVESRHYYTICHYCLEICWSGVPCEHCDWALFCSKDCSEKAWQEYHHIECAVGQFASQVWNICWRLCSMSLKILIKAMKDAGSVENLKAQLEAVDNCTDVRSKGFYKNGKFINNPVESFSSLTKMQLSEPASVQFPFTALLFLIGLLKHPQLENLYDIKNVEDLINNKDLVFLGSLLIKFIEIKLNNGFFIIGNIPQTARGFCVAPLLSLVNHSCCSNAKVRFTKDGKAILFALQPLEKDSQIFISYDDAHYYTACLEDRKEMLMNHKIECDCQACTEFWPRFELDSLAKSISSSDPFFTKFRAIVVSMKKNEFKAALANLRTVATLAFEQLKQPSVYTFASLPMIYECIQQIYDCFRYQELKKCEK